MKDGQSFSENFMSQRVSCLSSSFTPGCLELTRGWWLKPSAVRPRNPRPKGRGASAFAARMERGRSRPSPLMPPKPSGN